MRTLAEKVKAVRKLLDKPKAWTQGLLACNKKGDEVDPDDYDACAFCLVGAIAFVESGFGINLSDWSSPYAFVEKSETGLLIASVIMSNCPGFFDDADIDSVLHEFNDRAGMKHAEVLLILDEAHLHAVAAGI